MGRESPNKRKPSSGLTNNAVVSVSSNSPESSPASSAVIVSERTHDYRILLLMLMRTCSS